MKDIIKKEVEVTLALARLDAIADICLNLSYAQDLNLDPQVFYFLGETIQDMRENGLSYENMKEVFGNLG